MKRLFIGINFEDSTKQLFQTIQKQAEPFIEKGRISDVSNFHVTLQFIGMVHDEEISNVKNIMNQVEIKPMKLAFNHMGLFQKKNRFVVYIGCEPNEHLTKLANELNEKLSRADLVQRDLNYVPHLTIARNAVIKKEELEAIAVQYEVQVSEMTLYESTNIDGKLTYVPLYVVKAK